MSDSSILAAVLHTILQVLTFAWPVSEIVLAIRFRARGRNAGTRDRGSTVLLLVVIVAALGVAPALRHYPPTRIEPSSAVYDVVALACLLAGVSLRWSAILTLGRLFTINVAIDKDHSLILVGPFRWLRHPAYSGLLLAFLGVALSLRNWLSVAIVMVPISLALLYRMEVEEQALRERFGEAYERYAARTRRLIPFFY